MTDNKGLKYLLDQPNLNAGQAKWLDFLSEYDFEIKHIERNENKVAISLRRNAVMSLVAAISSYKTDLEDKLEEGIKRDPEYQNLKEYIT